MADGIERFTQFYELHVDAVFAYAASRTSRDRAEEVVEEVFVVAWRRFAEIPTSERSWLLRNLSIGGCRRSTRFGWSVG